MSYYENNSNGQVFIFILRYISVRGVDDSLDCYCKFVKWLLACESVYLFNNCCDLVDV